MYRDNYGREITFEEYRELVDRAEPELIDEIDDGEEIEKSFYTPELTAKWHRRRKHDKVQQ